MEIENYFEIIKEELEKMYPPYNRSNEGLVYLGLPQLLKSDYSLSDHQFLVTYLCLFVAIDFLVYHYYHDQYPTFKEKFNIPKFEYGLTNTFISPKLFISEKPELFRKRSLNMHLKILSIFSKQIILK